MTEVETKYNVTMMVDHPFVPKTCVNVPVVHWHKKKVPVCRPVTKKQCVTNWEVDHDGKKVSDSLLIGTLGPGFEPTFNSRNLYCPRPKISQKMFPKSTQNLNWTPL